MKDTTTEFSFILKPSKHGVGVFTTHPIKKGVHLRLFQDKPRVLKRKDVPEIFLHYCVAKNKDEIYAAKDFAQMEVGWYLNHSRDANAFCETDLNCFATRDIAAGEEILINYNELDEPEEYKEDYY